MYHTFSLNDYSISKDERADIKRKDYDIYVTYFFQKLVPL